MRESGRNVFKAHCAFRSLKLVKLFKNIDKKLLGARKMIA